MTIVATVTVEGEAFALGRILSASTTRIELTEFVPTGEQLVPYFWKAQGDDDEFERSVEASPEVASLVRLDGRVEQTLYRIEWTDDTNGFLGALQDLDILVEKATANGSDNLWTFHLRASDRETLSEFQRTCSEYGVGLDVRRIATDPEASGQLFTGLTTKQREALFAALERGYFDVPRDTSLAELAESVSISRQAFSRRLMRAEKTVFTNLLAEERAESEAPDQ